MGECLLRLKVPPANSAFHIKNAANMLSDIEDLVTHGMTIRTGHRITISVSLDLAIRARVRDSV